MLVGNEYLDLSVKEDWEYMCYSEPCMIIQCVTQKLYFLGLLHESWQHHQILQIQAPADSYTCTIHSRQEFASHLPDSGSLPHQHRYALSVAPHYTKVATFFLLRNVPDPYISSETKSTEPAYSFTSIKISLLLDHPPFKYTASPASAWYATFTFRFSQIALLKLNPHDLHEYSIPNLPNDVE